MSSSDQFPIPVRSAVKSNLTVLTSSDIDDYLGTEAQHISFCRYGSLSMYPTGRGQAHDTRHQVPYIPRPYYRLMWGLCSGCFPPEVSETAAWNLMVRPSLKWWSTTTDRSDFTVPSPITSTYLGIWECGSAWRHHTGKHGSSAPHQRITQQTSWP